VWIVVFLLATKRKLAGIAMQDMFAADSLFSRNIGLFYRL
jgi:hypothetical protein